MILTTQRLIFRAHILNIGRKEYYIPLNAIKYTQNGFHILTPTPNMIKIECNNEEEYRFVVKGKDKEKWKNLIMQYVLKAQKSNVKGLVRFCSNCGSEIVINTKFCSNCGCQIQK